MLRHLILAVLLTGLMFTLISCGDNSSKEPAQTQNTEQPAVAEQEPTLPAHIPPGVTDSSELAELKTELETQLKTEQAATAAAETSEPAAPNPWASLRAKDIDGNAFEFGDWLGNKPTVVNFWGTWCPPCRKEIPTLVQLYNEYNPKGVQMISIAVNDTPEKVRNYAQQNDMGWKMLLITQDMVQPFKLGNSVPTTIFYNASGQEVARFVGGRDHSTFKAAFERTLATN